MASSPVFQPDRYPSRRALDQERLRRGEQLRQRTERERLETSLSEYFKAVWREVLEPGTTLVWGWHLQVVCDHIQAMLEDWIRTQLEELGRVQAVPTGKLPEKPLLLLDELRRRSIIQRARAEGARLGMLQPDGHLFAVDADGQRTPVAQRAQDLCVNVPPGSSKTSIILGAAPTWMWLRWPSWRAICLSVNPNASVDWADRARDIIRSPWYQETFQPDWKLSDTSDAKGFYRNSAGGFRLSAGYTAKIIGGRGDALMLDDPDDPEGVLSKTVREATHRRWDNTLRNRLNDKRRSSRIIIQQRVQVEDLSGHILGNAAAAGTRCEHLRIPMEYRAPKSCFRDKKGLFTLCASCKRGHSFLGWKDSRAEGEAMDPVRSPPHLLAEEKAKSLIWEAQYQQEPQVLEGNIFKSGWWGFWRFPWQPEPPPELAPGRCITIPGPDEWPSYFEDGVISADLAFKKTAKGSRVCMGAFGRKGRYRMLLSVRWDVMDFPDTRRALRALIKEHPWIAARLVEDEANGPAILAELKAGDEAGTEAPLEGLIAVEPEGSKEARAHSVSPMVEAGDVLLPLWADWKDDALAETSAFPKPGERNDFVDMLSQALRHFKKAQSWRSLYE